MKQRKDFTEQDHLILEAAEQLGFVEANEDGTVYTVSDEAVVEFVSRIAKGSIEQTLSRCDAAVCPARLLYESIK